MATAAGMKKVVVFTGAGVSEESGIKTFRDSGGLWEEYDIMDVATPEAWHRNPKLVLEFYNARRKQVLAAKPNQAHRIIAEMEKHFEVSVITQNIDDLHERAGSGKVLNLHGEITKSRSSIDPAVILPVTEGEIRWGDKCPLGSQLRPHVVWFGEEVPAMMEAEMITSRADILIITGTSLNVYPAAGLVCMAPPQSLIYLVDPGDPLLPRGIKVRWIKEKAGEGLGIVFKELMS